MDTLKIQQMINNAKSNPTSDKAVYQFEAQEKTLMLDYLNNRLSMERLFDKLDKLETSLPILRIYSPQEFRYAMEFLNFTPEQIQSCLKQDFVQYQKALEDNLPMRFCMIFYRTLDSRLAVYVFTQKHLMRTMKDELTRVALQRAELLG